MITELEPLICEVVSHAIAVGSCGAVPLENLRGLQFRGLGGLGGLGVRIYASHVGRGSEALEIIADL